MHNFVIVICTVTKQNSCHQLLLTNLLDKFVGKYLHLRAIEWENQVFGDNSHSKFASEAIIVIFYECLFFVSLAIEARY